MWNCSRAIVFPTNVANLNTNDEFSRETRKHAMKLNSLLGLVEFSRTNFPALRSRKPGKQDFACNADTNNIGMRMNYASETDIGVKPS